MISTVLLIQADKQVAANAYLEELGWGPDSISVPLDPPWFGCHAFLTDDELAIVSAIDGIVLYQGEGSPVSVFNAALAEHNLTRVEVAADA